MFVQANSMCGIVAAVANRNIVPILLEGLRQLEYRGYDSAGLAVLNQAGQLNRLRTVGRVGELDAQVQAHQCRAHIGIAHTRWATHGGPSERNAHPHISGGLSVVHNGIIENHESLRHQLQLLGYQFSSETDTEVIAHLIHHHLKEHATLLGAVHAARHELQGAYALAVLNEQTPEVLVLTRQGSPLLLGLADDGNYAASDAAALLQVTRRFIYLNNGDSAALSRNEIHIIDRHGIPVTPEIVESNLSSEAIALGSYAHYMQKEIFEQPEALARTLEPLGVAAGLESNLFGTDADPVLRSVQQVLILACGTSWHAGCVARYWLESIAGIPCVVEIASEYRYRNSIPHPATLVIAISQSGETADTLAALQFARSLGMPHTMALCNVAESSLVREAQLRFITRAGPEIGVASTKAFTTQLAALYLLTIVMAQLRGRINPSRISQEIQALRHLPVALQSVLALEPAIRRWAKQFSEKQHALFLGRGCHYPIALEGALKLKEISYIHAEAYPAGELKHGPLALVDQSMPVIAIAPNDALLEKLKSNLQEVRARGGELFVFADADSAIPSSEGVHILRLPEHYGELSALLHVVPLQLLAYHVALVKGTDVDKPRNLAKSVTVE